MMPEYIEYLKTISVPVVYYLFVLINSVLYKCLFDLIKTCVWLLSFITFFVVYQRDKRSGYYSYLIFTYFSINVTIVQIALSVIFLEPIFIVDGEVIRTWLGICHQVLWPSILMGLLRLFIGIKNYII